MVISNRSRCCTHNGPNISQFHAIFWKYWQNCMLAPPCRVSACHLLRGILDLSLALHLVPNRVILLSVIHPILLINIWKVIFYLIKCWSDIEQYISLQIKVKLWKKDHKQLACFLLHFADLPHFLLFLSRDCSGNSGDSPDLTLIFLRWAGNCFLQVSESWCSHVMVYSHLTFALAFASVFNIASM